MGAAERNWARCSCGRAWFHGGSWRFHGLTAGGGPTCAAVADSATCNTQAGIFCSLMVTVAMQMTKAYIFATVAPPPPFPM